MNERDREFMNETIATKFVFNSVAMLSTCRVCDATDRVARLTGVDALGISIDRR